MGRTKLVDVMTFKNAQKRTVLFIIANGIMAWAIERNCGTRVAKIYFFGSNLVAILLAMGEEWVRAYYGEDGGEIGEDGDEGGEGGEYGDEIG